MKKILLIGQAPPLKNQIHPYDTTMLYEWLEEIGITKDQAQDLFEFEAMTDKIPEVKSGNQKPPSMFEMRYYYNTVLADKILKADVIILLGNTPIKFLNMDGFFEHKDLVKPEGHKTGKIFTLFHPSKRNRRLYNLHKDEVLWILREAYNHHLIYQKN